MERRGFLKGAVALLGAVTSALSRQLSWAHTGSQSYVVIVGRNHPPAEIIVGSHPSEIVTNAAVALQRTISAAHWSRACDFLVLPA